MMGKEIGTTSLQVSSEGVLGKNARPCRPTADHWSAVGPVVSAFITPGPHPRAVLQTRAAAGFTDSSAICVRR